MKTEKPRIFVDKDYLAGNGGTLSYLEVYKEGYHYYLGNGKLDSGPDFRTFEPLTNWDMKYIEKLVECGELIEFTGKKRDLFLAEHVLKR